MVLEKTAYQYILQPPLIQVAILYGLVLTGGILAALLNRSRAEIVREPYIIFSALITLFGVGVNSVWILGIQAMQDGYLWLLMLITLSATLLSGFFIGKIALARSRDAYGHGWNAYMAFLPFVNLTLIFKQPMKMESVNRKATTGFLNGGRGLVTGLMLFGCAYGIHYWLVQEAGRMAY